ncbi:MAG: N5-glutamine methyltransferase family protein [Actinomycetota bacterium]
MLDDVARRLAAAGCVAPEEEARELVRAAPDDATLAESIRRRESGEPLAWITGTMRFCGSSLRVDRGVYVPRPQSEELARRAASLLPEGGRLADLCTGCGAIALAVGEMRTSARVVAGDIDPGAVACARKNGVHAIRMDLGDALRPNSFDGVTSVAPYVPTPELRLLPSDVVRYEPIRALDGGEDGLLVLRRVVASAARILKRGGSLLTEIGGSQDEVLRPVLLGSGFDDVETWCDDAGDLRGIAARLG